MTSTKPKAPRLSRSQRARQVAAIETETAEFYRSVIKRAGQDDAAAIAQLPAAIRALDTVEKLTIKEGQKVERRRSEESNDAGGAVLDLAAARAEIGRRLACLRDAGDS